MFASGHYCDGPSHPQGVLNFYNFFLKTERNSSTSLYKEASGGPALPGGGLDYLVIIVSVAPVMTCSLLYFQVRRAASIATCHLVPRCTLGVAAVLIPISDTKCYEDRVHKNEKKITPF